MLQRIYPYRMVCLSILLAAALMGGLLAGCDTLAPMMSYQGRLTNPSGQPLNGTFSFQFRLFQAATGGNPIYSETKNIVVTDGLFDTSVGPTSVIAGLTPDMLTKPMWLEVSINGEALTPRQQILGSPYAFTLMPGAVISSTFTSAVAGVATNAILTVVNSSTASDALPALRLEGIGGLEMAGLNAGDGDEAGVIFSQRSSAHSDLRIASNDELTFDLDDNNNSTSDLRIRNGANAVVCDIKENGNLSCIGNSSFLGTKSAVVMAQDEQRLMYAMESPEVWFEDFGSAVLVNGVGKVTIDPLFAATVNLSEYHVFVTPLGDCKGLYVINKTASGFEVRELGGGTADIAFEYRIVAKRLGYEAERMELYDMESGEEE